MRQVATSFAGVPHRLELVRELRGVRWYNDSIATTPERVVAALKSFRASGAQSRSAPALILLAGGRDKHLPWEEVARLIVERVRHLVLFGEAAGLIASAVAAVDRDARPAHRVQMHHCRTLDEAVEVAARVARPGDIVLLSPGGTSFDAYRDFEERGEHMRQLVQALDESQ
jgi:UDP-N-acetylmuramoylalanine--D-glutamate ligase